MSVPSSSWFRAPVLLTVLVLGCVLGGCAQERYQIVRIQAGALAKSFFVGALADPNDDPEFYMRTSVIDVDSGAGSGGLFTSSDSEPVMRVRFEITETLLNVRLSYEMIQDTDHKGVQSTPGAHDGQIVAAYKIDKHFDIRRDYNSSTGEEYNVVVENDNDRPWYERDYFRVDWSRNLVTSSYDFDTLAQIGMWYATEWEPIAYYVDDPTHPDAPAFDEARGYFDITTKVWAKPDMIHDPVWGDYPACWDIGGFPWQNCNPSEAKLRTAFRRVTDTDYEPEDWDGRRMDAFGYFTSDRFGYDRGYGIVDPKWHRFIDRWNIWGQSHADPHVLCNTVDTTPVGADPHRDADGNGTEDECEAVTTQTGFGGSRCDEFKQLCTLPLRARPVKTIVWHVGPQNPDDMFPSSLEALNAWSDAVRVSVVAGRLNECRRTGGDNCEGEMGWPVPWHDDYLPPIGASAQSEVPVIFVLCHNPVDASKGDDESLCGVSGTAARLGDLRYNLLNIIQDPQLQAPWGIMMDASDPLTGETIAASTNVYGAATDKASARLADLVLLLNGLIAPDAYIKGQNVASWVQANQRGGAAERGRRMSADELQNRKQAFDPQVLTPYLTGIAGQDAKLPPKLRHQRRAKALTDSGRLGPGNSTISARMMALRGTPLETAMVSPEMAQAAGFDPTGPMDDQVVSRGSPVGHMNPAVRRERDRARRLWYAERHSCRLEELEPDVLLGMARALQQQFPWTGPADPNDPTYPAALQSYREQIYNWARAKFNRGVAAHELGHSMGLRHNFAASWDALNYGLPYWQLRTHNGEITAQCADGNTDGSNCVGPRWKDPLTDEEINGNIGAYSTSSVMDYPGDSNQDMILPGKYDRAAMRFAYGGTVDVWNVPGVSVTAAANTAGKRTAFRLASLIANPGIFGVYWFSIADPDPNNGPWYEFIHYSRWQDKFGLLGDCAADSSPDAVLGSKCTGQPLDVVDYRDMKDWVDDPNYASFDWAVVPHAVDGQGRVRHAYLFSSDEYADVGNVPTFTDDSGADAYEQIAFAEGMYENRYVLDGFRRDRVMFSSQGTTERIQAYYLDPVEQIVKSFAFGALLDGDPLNPSAGFLDDGNYGALEMGSTLALDMFGRILTRPEPGYYCPSGACGGAQPIGVDVPVYQADTAALPDVYLYDFHVSLPDGRYLHNDYDYSQGYYWGDYQKQVGCYYEKVWATYYLGEAYDYFISNSKEDFVDGRYKNVNFATVFPSQVRRLYNNLLTNDVESYAPFVVPVVVDPNLTPEVTLQYPNWHDIAGPGARPAGALIPDPNYSWNEQIYAMVWGAVFFPSNWSQQWVHEARITVLPSETPDWPVTETYAFFDPTSGLTYRAHSSGSEPILGTTRQRSAGARMLEWANKLVTVAYLVQRDGNGDPIFNADGTPILVDGNGVPLLPGDPPVLDPANPGADSVLARYVDTIDTMRQITVYFQQAVGDGDLPQP